MAHSDLRELSSQDPRWRTFSAVLCVWLLGLVGFAIWGRQSAQTLLLLAACIAVVVGFIFYAEWRVRRHINVWATDEDVLLARGGELIRIPWTDIEEIRTRWPTRCVMRFRRETPVGHTLQFDLPFPDHSVGFDHPLVVWMRDQAGLPSAALDRRPQSK
jgi:hypothetical protein